VRAPDKCPSPPRRCRSSPHAKRQGTMHPKREAIQKDKNFETCKSPNSRSQLPGLVCLEIHQGQPGRPPARTQVAALVVVVIMLNCFCKQAHEDVPRADGASAMPTGCMTTKEFNMTWSLSQAGVKQASTGLCQSVFLQAAVGFIGDRHLYQIGLQRWPQMQCQKIRPM